jgi:hypothetical protein
MNRKDLEARYKLFEKFALDDQRNYYKRTIEKHNKAAAQVNFLRALIALATAICAALVGLISAFYFAGATPVCQLPLDESATTQCHILYGLTFFLIVMAIGLPALGGFFNSLADLFQWDRLISIYESAVENIEVADARSPDPDMDDLDYRASLRAFAEGTLQVMSDETAQWGQSIRTPPALEKFVEEERKLARRYGGDADAPPDTENNLPDIDYGALG